MYSASETELLQHVWNWYTSFFQTERQVRLGSNSDLGKFLREAHISQCHSSRKWKRAYWCFVATRNK